MSSSFLVTAKAVQILTPGRLTQSQVINTGDNTIFLSDTSSGLSIPLNPGYGITWDTDMSMWAQCPTTSQITVQDMVGTIYQTESNGSTPVVGVTSITATSPIVASASTGNVNIAFQDTGWISPTLANSWVNFGSGQATAQYRLLGGVVYVKGVVIGGVPGVTSNVFTLPAGFRPAETHVFAVSASSGIGRLNVTSAGVVNAAAGLATSYFALDCWFVAEN